MKDYLQVPVNNIMLMNMIDTLQNLMNAVAAKQKREKCYVLLIYLLNLKTQLSTKTHKAELLFQLRTVGSRFNNIGVLIIH